MCVADYIVLVLLLMCRGSVKPFVDQLYLCMLSSSASPIWRVVELSGICTDGHAHCVLVHSAYVKYSLFHKQSGNRTTQCIVLIALIGDSHLQSDTAFSLDIDAHAYSQYIILRHQLCFFMVMQCCVPRVEMIYSHLLLLSVEESMCSCGEPAEVRGSLPDLSLHCHSTQFCVNCYQIGKMNLNYVNH